MKKALILILAALVISSSAFAATYKSSDGKISFSAPALEYGNYKVSAKGNKNYKSASKTVTVKITVK